MQLADHIRPLLRVHDCVIIPDFGGLVAEVSSARAQPGRQALSPPTKLVAFNQALTRNDGLLVDALSQHLNLPIAQAREAVRTAVAALQAELATTNRTELPGIGVFRRAVGRGLAFEYTGTDNLLAAAFGLPELAARPVRAADARPLRPQPALRGAATRRPRWARLLPGGIVAVAAGLLLLANYQVAQTAGYLPASWRAPLLRWEWAPRRSVPAAPAGAEPQQATLGQQSFAPAPPEAAGGMTLRKEPVPAPALASGAKEAAAGPDATVPAVREAVPVVVTDVTPALTPTAKPGGSAVALVITAPVAVGGALGDASAAIPATGKAPVAPAGSAAAAAPARPAARITTTTTTIKNRTGRYYVIAGAYRSLANAEQGRRVLARTGHPARVILPPYGSRLFRLTAADYPDLASARREAQRLRVRTRADYNTLKF